MANGTITIQGGSSSQDFQDLRTTDAPAVDITGEDLTGGAIVGTEGPDVLNGTDGNDTIESLGGDDTIFGSLGQDRVDGGTEGDTVDYSFIDGTITLLPQGLLDNGDPQTSQLVDIETIIGTSGQQNTIDASAVTADLGASLNVDLGADQLTVNGIPGLGTQNFTVQNFPNVEGTQNNDSIVGNGEANTISGNGGNDLVTGAGASDVITGGDGNDTLSGTDGFARGAGELDNLSGSTGTDRFILGDTSGSFYNGQGDSDFATISDFSAGEQIQLGTGDNYQIARGVGNFQVFATTGGTRDLIADVSFGSSSSGARTTNSTDALASDALTTDALTAIPEGDFSISSGESVGVFVGA